MKDILFLLERVIINHSNWWVLYAIYYFFVLYKWSLVAIGTNTFGTKYIIHITVIINNSKRKKKKERSHQNDNLMCFLILTLQDGLTKCSLHTNKFYLILRHNGKPCNCSQSFLSRPALSSKYFDLHHEKLKDSQFA